MESQTHYSRSFNHIPRRRSDKHEALVCHRNRFVDNDTGFSQIALYRTIVVVNVNALIGEFLAVVLLAAAKPYNIVPKSLMFESWKPQVRGASVD